MNNINPAWQVILDTLPGDLHKLVTPALQKWDDDVKARFEEIHKEYESYKPFKQFIDNNIAADFAWQSVVMADELQRDPAKVAAQINEAFDLGFVDKTTHEQALAAVTTDSSDDGSDDGLFEDGKLDLSKIPEFQTMKQTLEALQGTEEQKRKEAEDQAAIEEFNAELDALEKSVTEPDEGEGKPFNRMFVTALMAQGLSGEDAVKQFHTLLAGNAVLNENDNTDESGAPITMGNSGNVGSGSADGSVNYADMNTSDFNETVAKALEAMQTGS